jgi:hypothetical protein
MTCQHETESGTCRGEAYSECWDCLRRLCDKHVAYRFGIKSMCANCKAERERREEQMLGLPQFPVSLRVPEGL